MLMSARDCEQRAGNHLPSFSRFPGFVAQDATEPSLLALEIAKRWHSGIVLASTALFAQRSRYRKFMRILQSLLNAR